MAGISLLFIALLSAFARFGVLQTLVAGAGHAPWLDELDRAAKSTTTFLQT